MNENESASTSDRVRDVVVAGTGEPRAQSGGAFSPALEAEVSRRVLGTRAHGLDSLLRQD
jgi:hypothetical protein